MKQKIHRYSGKSVEVSWDAKRCIHAAECVRGLPEVFDPDARPWVRPDEAPDDAVAEIVLRCPTGALHLARPDRPEEEPVPNQLRVVADGPIYARGDLELCDADAEVILADRRAALCRCGLSSNKPLCDNSHREAFEDRGALGESSLGEGTGDDAVATLTLRATAGGPLVLSGPFRITDAEGRTRHGTKAALCRCGASSNKPFCDGSHARVGFAG